MSSVGRLLGCIAWMRGMCDAIPMRLKSWRDVDMMPYLVYVTSYPLLKSSWRRHDAIPMWRLPATQKFLTSTWCHTYVTSYPLLKSSWRRHDAIPICDVIPATQKFLTSTWCHTYVTPYLCYSTHFTPKDTGAHELPLQMGAYFSYPCHVSPTS